MKWNYKMAQALIDCDFSERAKWARDSAHLENYARILFFKHECEITPERLNALICLMPFMKSEDIFTMEESHVRYSSGLGEVIYTRHEHNESASSVFKLLNRSTHKSLLTSFIPRTLRYIQQYDGLCVNLPELLAILEEWSNDKDAIMYALVNEFTTKQRKETNT